MKKKKNSKSFYITRRFPEQEQQKKQKLEKSESQDGKEITANQVLRGFYTVGAYVRTTEQHHVLSY